MWLYVSMNSLIIFFSIMVYHRKYLLKNNFIDLFIFGWADLHYCVGFSLVVASGGCSLGVGRGFLIVVVSPVWSLGSRERGLSSCGSRASEHRLSKHKGFAALQHMGSSQTRDRTCVPCTDSQILYHWATREFPFLQKLLRKKTSICWVPRRWHSSIISLVRVYWGAW